MIANGYRVFLWDDTNVLKLARGDGCIVKVLIVDFKMMNFVM